MLSCWQARQKAGSPVSPPGGSPYRSSDLAFGKASCGEHVGFCLFASAERFDFRVPTVYLHCLGRAPATAVILN
jgi:hypothetical protein